MILNGVAHEPDVKSNCSTIKNIQNFDQNFLILFILMKKK